MGTGERNMFERGRVQAVKRMPEIADLNLRSRDVYVESLIEEEKIQKARKPI